MNNASWCHWVFSLVGCFIAPFSFAQGNLGSPVHLSESAGLPSSTVYSLFQDSKGYVWMATDKGVVRYDGFEIEVFSVRDGLADDENFSIVEDSLGRIWFGAYNGQPSFYQEGRFYNQANCAWLQKIHVSGYIQHMEANQDGGINLSGKIKGWYIIQGDSVIELPGEAGVMVYGVVSMPNGYGVLTNRSDSIWGIYDIPIYNSQTAPITFIRNLGYKMSNSDRWLASLDMGFSQATLWDKEERKQWPYKVILPDTVELLNIVFADPDRLLLVARRGIYQVYLDSNQSSDFVVNTPYLIPEGQATHVLIDDEDNIWVSTLDNGVFFFPQGLPVDRLYRDEEGTDPILGLHKDSYGDFWRISASGILEQSTQHGAWEKVIDHEPNTNLTRFYGSAIKNRIWVHTAGGYSKYITKEGEVLFQAADNFIFEQEAYILRSTPRGTFNAYLLPDERNREGFQRLDIAHRQVKLPYSLPYRISTTCKVAEDSVIIGYQDGVATFSPQDSTFQLLHSRRIFREVSALAQSVDQDGDNWLWLGEKNLFGVNGRGDTLMSDANLFEQNRINSIYPIADSVLLLGTTNGLYYFQWNPDQLIYQGRFTKFQGLPDSDVREVDFWNDSLWVVTKRGVVKLPIDEILKAKETQPLRVQIKGIWIDNQLHSVREDLVAEGRIENLRIKLSAFNFSQQGGIVFEYRLRDGFAWQSITSNELQMASLGPGVYPIQFRVRAIGNHEDTVTKLRVEVLPYWWQRGWVLVMGLGLLVIMIIALVQWRVYRIKKRAQQALEMSELELKALKAQMSPHFIFNVLSSIQRFILANDPGPANEYLTKFSRLTRIVLNHSDRTTVKLSEEIQSLQLYVELEQLRLNNQFAFELLIDEVLNPEVVEIPPLMLQTFVENAIWHGLSPVTEGGRLEIVFSKNGHFLNIIIRDNGIGRAAAQKRNPRAGISKGSILTTQKLAVLNKTLYEGQALLHIRDRFHDDGTAAGTEVIIELPL